MCEQDFRQVLSSAKKSGALVAVYTEYTFEDDFDVGTIIHLDDRAYGLAAVSPIGL